MESLINKIAGYKNASQSLIDKIEDLEAKIKKEVPFEFWKDLNIVEIARSGYHHFRVNGKIIPGVTEKFGKGFYWGGDFNHWNDYVTGKDLVKFFKEDFPEMVKSLENKIEKITSLIQF